MRKTTTNYKSQEHFQSKHYPQGEAEMQTKKQQNWVFQLKVDKQPLDMIHPGRCRELQNRGKLASLRKFPYVVIQQKTIDIPQTTEAMVIAMDFDLCGLTLIYSNKTVSSDWTLLAAKI